VDSSNHVLDMGATWRIRLKDLCSAMTQAVATITISLFNLLGLPAYLLSGLCSASAIIFSLSNGRLAVGTSHLGIYRTDLHHIFST